MVSFARISRQTCGKIFINGFREALISKGSLMVLLEGGGGGKGDLYLKQGKLGFLKRERKTLEEIFYHQLGLSMLFFL